MPFLVALLVIALIIAFLFLSTLFIVPQQQAYIIERFGKFNKVQFAGIHIRIPFVDRIAMKTNMRVNQLNVQLETKTLDNVFVTVVASTQFRVNPENVATAYYELRDPAGQLRSYMEDALRSAIPALSLDDAFARKDDVAFDVLRSLSESNNAKTVVLPASTPGGYQDMYSQITQAMVTANETAGQHSTVPTPPHVAPTTPRI